MAVKVYKKYRLLEFSGGDFKKDSKKLIRTVKVDELYAKEQNAAYKISGIYYELDEEATKKRDGEDEPSREELKAKADALGLEYPNNIRNEKLKALIEEAE